MSVLFPPSLRQHLTLGHQESAPTGSTKEIGTSTGAPILLPIGSSRHRPMQGTLHLRSEDELDLFQDWHWESLNRGTRRFIWHRPGRASESYELQFTGSHYSIGAPSAEGYFASLELILVRQVS